MQMLDRSTDFRPDDSWCRRLGNFPSPGWGASTASITTFPVERPAAARRAWRDNRAALRAQVLQAAFGVATAAALAVSYPAAAQGMGGGMGGHGGRGSHSNSTPSSTASKADPGPSHVANPLRAMLGEMPKLRADLMLTSTQINSWSAMEDALRDTVELGRARIPAATAGESGTDAELFVRDMADNEHLLSEAMARLASSMKAAIAVLNPRQAKLVHERFAAAIDAELPGAPR